MKRFILITLISIITLSSNAQDSSDRIVSGGLYFGPTISWLSTDSKTINTPGSKMGFNFGATMDLKITNNFLFNLALGYNNCGGKVKFLNGAKEFKANSWDNIQDLQANSIVKYRTSFLEIPISVKGRTNEIAYVSYYSKAGITPMLAIKSKADIIDANNLEKGTYTDDLIVSKYTSFFNLGWHIGGGAEYSIVENTKIFAELIFTGGIIDYEKTRSYKTDKVHFETPRTLVKYIQLKVGVLF